jgi:hypothetical protein
MKTNLSNLSQAEIKFLLEILVNHQNYYRLVITHERCSPRNRQMFELVESLCRKLESSQVRDPAKQ